jgi:hypothetical protein
LHVFSVLCVCGCVCVYVSQMSVWRRATCYAHSLTDVCESAFFSTAVIASVDVLGRPHQHPTTCQTPQVSKQKRTNDVAFQHNVRWLATQQLQTPQLKPAKRPSRPPLLPKLKREWRGWRECKTKTFAQPVGCRCVPADEHQTSVYKQQRRHLHQTTSHPNDSPPPPREMEQPQVTKQHHHLTLNTSNRGSQRTSTKQQDGGTQQRASTKQQESQHKTAGAGTQC